MSDQTLRDPGATVEAPKEISKRAAEKARKKAEKLAKKTELALRPKEQKETKEQKEQKEQSAAGNVEKSVFNEGWLKRVHELKKQPVRTRFPPEPNGYLHIGHAKAIAVNFGFAKYYNGITFLRYDDTNPEKEEEVYFKSIQDIVKWLGFEPYEITYSSDHFQRLYDLGEELIRRDKGYVCHCTREQTNMQRGGPDNRGTRFACEHRDRPTEESLTEFRAMRDGKYKAGEAHLRMKQSIADPNEGNPQMWDLAAFRVVENNHHHRTGDKWKIYPTYDFTHCLVDAFEGITHSLCTTEFYLSRTSYNWLCEVLDFKVPNSEEKGPMQREYGRLNVTGTILSKRRIMMLVMGTTVEKKNADGTVTKREIPPVVRGWDDPRLYTLVALRRRGIPARALLDFVEGLGVTDALTDIQASRLESSIRKHLERSVPRLMAVLDPIKVVIEDLPESDEKEFDIPYDPKGSIPGTRAVKFSKELYIDRSDFREEDDPNFFRLAPNKVVGLLNIFPIKATSFSKDAEGRVTEIRAVKAEGEKPKAYIHWVDVASATKVTARQYNPLFKSETPNTLDWKEGGWHDDINPQSEIVYENAMVEKALAANLMAGQARHEDHASDALVRFQAVRTAYFCVDQESTNDKIVLNQIVSLKEDKAK